MELDSQSITPPSSPIFGYSRDRGNVDSILESGIIFCLNCKGAPRQNDVSFSPESYILRGEAMCALNNLGSQSSGDTQELPQVVQCFGASFDPTDKGQLKTMIAICRMKISSLEILSETSHTFKPAPGAFGMLSGGFLGNPENALIIEDDPDELQNQDPWLLRRSICQFLNVIVRQLKYYKRSWNIEELQGPFSGLRMSLQSVKSWSNVLKTHCGFGSGNDCTSSTYHFFHLQLELRWSLFMIFGATLEMADWFLDDLVQLTIEKYNQTNALLESRQSFNCLCVKEIWTMVRLILDEVKPSQMSFWDYFVRAMKRIPPQTTDVFFPVWLISNLSQIGSYSIAGVFCSEKENINSKGSNGYKYLNEVLKEWGRHGGKSTEILKLIFKCITSWGGDCEVVLTIWGHWVPRLDKGIDITNFEPYSSLEKWLKLVSQIRDCATGTSVTPHQGLAAFQSQDPFLEFICLVAAQVGSCSDRDIRKLTTNICMKLSRANASEFSELGIIRVSTLFMVLASRVDNPLATTLSERLQDTLSYGKGNSTVSRRKTLLRAYSAIIIVLLQKNIDITKNQVVAQYMKKIDEFLSQSGTDSIRKDLVMVYVELLSFLPKSTPNFKDNSNLGRQILISSNLLMWLANCGPNHVLRTVQALSQITGWIVTFITKTLEFESISQSEEAKDLFERVRDKCLPFMKTNVLLNENRIPTTDMEHLANLSADLTILTRKFCATGKALDECSDQFARFALNERTCPEVSQYYIERLCRNREFLENGFTELKWTQSWIRLLALKCSVPDELTQVVLGTNFCSTSNLELFRAFCKRESEWGKEDIQNILTPLAVLVNSVVHGNIFKDGQSGYAKEKCGSIIRSVITCCTEVFRHMSFDKVYLKGVIGCCGHKFLDNLIVQPWPGIPPWEKNSPEVLKALELNLFDIFYAIVTHPGLPHDPYLSRKLQYLVVFSFFGFTRNPEEIDKDNHPALKILNYCEDNDVTLVKEQILPHVIAGDNVIRDIKLSQKFLGMVTILRCKQFPTLVIRVLNALLHIYLLHPVEKVNMNSCSVAITYCCQFGVTPFYKKDVIDAFERVLEKHFAFKSKRVYELFFAVAKAKKKDQIRKFLKTEVIPLLTKHVELCEERRGIGRDKSLRTPLEVLIKETGDIPT